MKKLISKSVTLMVAVAVILAVAVAFAGCEETQATLEDIASSDSDMTKTIKSNIETPEGTTVAVAFSGDSFDVVYTYDDVIDESLEKLLIGAFDKNEDKMKESCEAAIDSLQTQTGITGIVGTLKIVNANGTELWCRTYPEK